ncbi:MAG: TonB-dependent receptor [Balneolaceae bacterium]
MNTRFFYLIFPLLFLLQGTATAQQQGPETYSFEFRGEMLVDVLDRIAQTADIDLVYDPKLVHGIQVYQRFRNETIETLLQSLLQNKKLDFITLSSGTLVIVRTVEGDPAYGTLSGRIVDRATGEPLPGATVMLADASGGTSTGRSGNFSMNRLLSGSYHITFSYIGYEPVYKTIEIIPDRQVREQISLERKPVDVLPVVVESHHPVMPNQRNGSSVDTDRNWEPAGAMKDAIRNLSLIPGVQYGLPMNDLHLQGGQRSEHRILLDGVPVYNPYSFGQMFSSFSPFAIGKVNLHKAGYGVQQGSQIAGLINLSHDVPVSDKNSAVIQGDPLSLNLRADLNFPAGGESPFKVMTALRTNFWNIYKDPALARTLEDWHFVDPLITSSLTNFENDASVYSPAKHESDVKFFDYHFAAGYEPDEYNSLSVSFYTAENSIATELLSQAPPAEGVPPYLFTRDEHAWQNFMGQVTWNSMASPRFDFTTQASFSANRFRHQNTTGHNVTPLLSEGAFNQSAGAVLDAYNRSGRWLPTEIDGNKIQHFILRSDGSYSFNRRFKMEGGIQMDLVSSEVGIRDLMDQPALAGQSSAFFSTFLNGKYTVGSYWNIEGGSRFTAVNFNEAVYAEPRLSVQYDHRGSGTGYWSARLAGGIYRQFIHEYNITNTGAASLVPGFTVWSHGINSEIPKARHLSGSFLVQPAEYTSVKLEGFYKHQPDTYVTSYLPILTESEFRQKGVSAFVETTEMTSFGAGIRINQSLAQSKLKLVAGYDYNSSRIDLATQYGREMPAPWNEPHRAQFRTLWHLFPDLTIAAKWQGIWGRSWGFRQSYYNFLRYQNYGQTAGYFLNTPEDDKLNPFHQLDLSFIYQPSTDAADFEIRLELINLLNRVNTIDQTLLPTGNPAEPFEIRKRNLPGFFPSASLQVKF